MSLFVYPCRLVMSHPHSVRFHQASSEFRHDLRLASSFVSVIGQEPQFTNYTEGFKGTIDYIMATCDDMYCSGAYLIPSKEELAQHTSTCLPNPQFPSDHLGLCADFHFIQPGGGVTGATGDVGANGVGANVGGQQAIRMPTPQRRRPLNASGTGGNNTGNSNRRNGRYHR